MRKNNRIVIICPYLFRLTRGIERFCISLSKAFADKGYDVVIYAWGTIKENSCGEIDKRIKIRKVPYCRWYQEKIAVLFYRWWLRQDNPKATILNFLYHGEISLPRKRKYLYILHSPASQIPGRYEFVKNHIEDFENIHVIAISKMVEEEARPYVGNAPMTLIYNGTDTQLFKPSAHKIQNSKLNIITAAAFEKRKGMHYIIAALADYEHRDQVKYDIYGSGDEQYTSYLSNLIKSYELDGIVELKGSVSNISELLPTYDLFALPSKGEAFALSPIEAMACGVPILVSNYPPYPEFVKSDFGYAINREDKRAIYNCLNELLQDKELLQAKSCAARKAGEKFSWNSVVNQYIDLIK